MSGYGIFLILLLHVALNDGTTEADKNSTVSLIRQVLNDITLLTEHIQSQETRLSERIRGLETDFAEQMRIHEIKMSEQMQSQELRLTQQIKRLETTKMTKKIHELETKMAGVEVKMTDGMQGLKTDVQGLKTEIAGVVHGLETNVTEKMVNMTERMTSQKEKLTERMQLQEERLTERITRLDTKITRQMEQEELKTREQDARLRVVESLVNINASDAGELSKEIKKMSLKVDVVNKVLTGVLPGKTKNNPAPSCNWLRDHYFNLRKGRYWIVSKKDQPIYVYCDMAPINIPFTECNGANITSAQSVIKYPVSGNYHVHEDCKWNIQTGESVTLLFTRFDLADNTYYDYVSIYNDGNEIGRWGRYKGIPPQQTLNGDIQIQFHTGDSNVATGFQAYVFSNKECLFTNHNHTDTNMTLVSNMTSSANTYCTYTKCRGSKITTTQTSIKYPATGNYDNNEVCEWNIETGMDVTLDFTHFDLDDNVWDDFVAIFVDENEIGRWGGNNVPPQKTLNGHIKIIFHSDYSNSDGTGFQVYINDSL